MKSEKTIVSWMKGIIGLIRPMGLMGLIGLMRPMGPIKPIGPMAAALVALLLLVACSSDGDAPENPPTPPTVSTDSTTPTDFYQLDIPIVLSMSAAPFTNVTEKQRAARRAWEPPTDYSLYSNIYGADTYVNLPNLGQSTIDLYMTHDVAEGFTSPNPLHARLSYSSATNKWKLGLPNDVDEKNSVKKGNYYAYGFIPKDAADGAEIAKLRINDVEQPWAKGAVLTIRGLKTVATDPCVIIGAKHGFAVEDEENIDYYDGEYTDKNGNATYDDGTDTRTNRLRAGNFQFKLDTDKTGEEGHDVINPNYLYFLFDHLYSALSISMRVNGEYDKLRHIKLKKLKLRTLTSEGVSPYKSDMTITLKANNEGTNPVSDNDISYDNIVDSPTDGVIYSNSTGFLLGTEYSLFLGNFMPNGITKLILTSTYDVYDREYNLVRKDCEATNTIVLSEVFIGQDESYRGWKYIVKLTINPTYLYVMSDPDLNNPTVRVE
jgi:hypothetical protein